MAFERLENLGYLSLAIDQAGAYIAVQQQQQQQQQQFSSSSNGPYSRILIRYLKLYDENKDILLRQKPPPSTWNYRNDTVFTTWEVSFQAIEQESSDAARILLLCGFLARRDIYIDLLRHVSGEQLEGERFRSYNSIALVSR